MATSLNGLTFLDSAGVSPVNGVFIPLASLPGLIASEFADAQPDHLKYSKAVLALCEALHNAIIADSFPGSISFSANKLNPAGSGLNQVNQTFSFSYTKALDLQDQTIIEIPEPITGTNTGIGAIDFPDIFPNAAKIANADTTSGAGLIIETATLAAYSSVSHATLTIDGTTDNREAISGFMATLGASTLLRTATQASAITARTIQVVPTIGAVPASFTALPNPVSGIAVADLINRSLITRTVTITVNLLLNIGAQSFDVRSVVA